MVPARTVRSFAAAIASLCLTSCEQPIAPHGIPLGRYDAVRINGAPLADQRICGIGTIVSSSLVLESASHATYAVHYRVSGQPDQIFAGSGTARLREGYLVVRTRGVWSHAPEEGVRSMMFVFEVVGAELVRREGMACDAYDAIEHELR